MNYVVTATQKAIFIAFDTDVGNIKEQARKIGQTAKSEMLNEIWRMNNVWLQDNTNMWRRYKYDIKY